MPAVVFRSFILVDGRSTCLSGVVHCIIIRHVNTPVSIVDSGYRAYIDLYNFIII